MDWYVFILIALCTTILIIRLQGRYEGQQRGVSRGQSFVGSALILFSLAWTALAPWLLSSLFAQPTGAVPEQLLQSLHNDKQIAIISFTAFLVMFSWGMYLIIPGCIIAICNMATAQAVQTTTEPIVRKVN